jgi:hypothetical protein
MRACEGCRRRKIKCDAATTNTWPCSACIRLKLHCVRPNGQYDGTGADSSGFETSVHDFSDSSTLQDSFRQQMPMQQQQVSAPQHMVPGVVKPGPSMYAAQSTYPDASNIYQHVSYAESPTSQHNLHYTTVPPSVPLVDQSYAAQNVFPTPPLQHGSRSDSPPAAYSPDSYQQPDLADLLGSLKVNESGTGKEVKILVFLAFSFSSLFRCIVPRT